MIQLEHLQQGNTMDNTIARLVQSEERYRDTEIQRYRDTEGEIKRIMRQLNHLQSDEPRTIQLLCIQYKERRDTEKQRYRDTEILRYRDTEGEIE